MKKSDGSAYVPLPRNNAILCTPDDPEATFRYMIEAWERSDEGSEGWYRIIAQAGPELTWERLMVDETKPYARLIPTHVRERVLVALDRDAGTAKWRRRQSERQQADRDRTERIARLRAQYRAGAASRPVMPELDESLRSPRRRGG